MQLSVVLVLALCGAVFAADLDDGVYVGTDSNFQELVDSTEFVLAEFYAPWCGHCKTLAPEYVKAATALTDLTNVKLVKVDATVHSSIAEKFEVQGYPTLKFFRNGVASEYSGGRTAGEISGWIRKKAGPVSAVVSTAAELTTLQAGNDVVVFGAFKADSNELKSFLEAASRAELVFAHTTDAAVATEAGISLPGLVIFTKFEVPKTVYSGKFDADSIAEFVDTQSLPLINFFSDETASKIFGGRVKQHLLLFANKASESYDSLISTLKSVVPAFRGQILFVVIDTAVEENSRVVDFFHLTEKNLPAIRVIDLTKDMAKFNYDKEITTDALTAYLTDFFAGKISRHLNSQPLPEDWDAQGVKVLVGENFAKVALAEDNHAFVEFYAPWCGHCKELVPTWDALAEKFKDNADVVIAKIDMTANELEQVSVQSFPTLKFFKKGDKSNPIDYNGTRDLPSFVAFVEEQIKKGGAEHDEF